MRDTLHFETPENVKVQYIPAGLGTRYVAWFVDQFFVGVLMVIVIFLILIAGTSLNRVLEDIVDRDLRDPKKVQQLATYLIGAMILIMGLGSFFYYVFFELLWRGQTVGKKLCKIRVVKLDGFALDPGSILLRNVFRVLDQFPVMWIVPVMSRRSQRTGDMVGGTIVVSDDANSLSDIRVELGERKAIDAEFRFDHRSLQRLTERDFDAVERMLERWTEMPKLQREALSDKLTRSLAIRLNADPPVPDRSRRFLEDLLAAELRRQSRMMA